MRQHISKLSRCILRSGRVIFDASSRVLALAVFSTTLLCVGCLSPVVTIGPPACRLLIVNHTSGTISGSSEVAFDALNRKAVFIPGNMPPGASIQCGVIFYPVPETISAQWTLEPGGHSEVSTISVPAPYAGSHDFCGQIILEITDTGLNIEVKHDPLHIPA